MAKVGRPLLWRSAKDLRKAIDAYFATSSLKSMSGLTLALGFLDRDALLSYEKKGEFSGTVKWARLKVAQYYEEQAQQVKNPSFQIFALKNFGWSDKQEVEHSGTVSNIVRFPLKSPIGAPVDGVESNS